VLIGDVKLQLTN